MPQTKINTNPIQWYEGMLLMPQHFQQAGLRQDHLLHYHVKNIAPFYWGIVKLDIDQASLSSGLFRILSLEAIMPDGLLISEVPSVPLQIDLMPQAAEMQSEPLTIYLCIPQAKGNSADIVGGMPRYRSVEGGEASDLNTGDQEVMIPRLEPSLSLVASTQPPMNYVWLPLAKVTFDTKSFSFVPYIPPSVSTPLTSPLGQKCGQVALKLREKLGYLQQKVLAARTSHASANPFVGEIENTRLRLISGLLPYEAVLSPGNAHPFTLFQALCAVAANISGVSYGSLPPRFESYNHNDLEASFNQVIDFIQKILDEIQETYTVIPFIREGAKFSLKLQTSWIGEKLVLGARAPEGVTRDQLAQWVMTSVIVTKENISRAKENRVLGASRALVDEVPSLNLLPLKGVQLFVVDQDPLYIDPEGVLTIFNAADEDTTRPLEIVLYNSNQALLGK